MPLLFHTVDESTKGIQLLCCNLVDRRQNPFIPLLGCVAVSLAERTSASIPTRSQLYKIWRGSRCMAFPKMLTTTQILLNDSSLKSVSSSFSSSSFPSIQVTHSPFHQPQLVAALSWNAHSPAATVFVNLPRCTVTRVIHICAGSASRATLAAA